MPLLYKVMFAITLVIGSHQFVHAQNARMDSLKNLLSTAKGTELVDITNKLAFDWYLYNVDSSYEYSSNALQMAEELHYTKGMAEATIYQGIYQYLTGDSKKGQQLLLKAQKLAKESNAKGLEGYAFVQLGNLNRNLGKYDSAKYFYDQSYSILKDSLNPWYLGSLYGNLSKYYNQTSQPKNEIKYLLRANAVREKLGDKVLMMDGLLLLSAWYSKEYELGKAADYLIRAEKLVSVNTPTEIVIDVKYQRATVLSKQGKYEEALSLFDEVKSYYQQNTTPQIYVKVLTDIGYTFEQIGDYEASQKLYFEALKIAEENKYPLEQTKLNVRIGWIYYYLKQSEYATKFVLKALTQAQMNNYRLEEGEAYNLSGILLDDQGKADEAQMNFEKALDIRKEINDRKGIAASLGNLGDLMETKGKLQEALAFHTESLEIDESIANRPGMTWSYLFLGRVNMKLNDFGRAEQFYDMAEDEARALKLGNILSSVYRNRRDMLERQGNVKEALRYSKLYETLQDSVFKQSMSNRIANLQRGYEMEQKDKEIELLNQAKVLQGNELVIQKARLRQQWFVLATVVVGLLFFGTVAYLLFRINKKTSRLNKEISERNEEIQAQSEELMEANEAYSRMNKELAEQKEELATQSEEMSEANDALSVLNQALAEKQEEIATQNEELTQNNEEIITQRDLVHEQNLELERIKKIVEQQNEEIKKRNENLEIEVENRTKELVEYNQQLEQFAFISSHNLRAPVARILGLGQLLELPDKTATDEILVKQKLIDTTRELDRVVKDLNTILEIKKNNTAVLTEIDLNEEIELIKINLGREIVETKVEIKSDFSRVPIIKSIRPYLDSILINLVSNAIKYRTTDRFPIVTISTELRGEFVCLMVKDNGLGIDLPLYKDKMFSLYKRFHDHVEGKGLGLYLVKTQITALGGKIEVESEVNVGTTFFVYIERNSQPA